jgi:hypothetical protein
MKQAIAKLEACTVSRQVSTKQGFLNVGEATWWLMIQMVQKLWGGSWIQEFLSVTEFWKLSMTAASSHAEYPAVNRSAQTYPETRKSEVCGVTQYPSSPGWMYPGWLDITGKPFTRPQCLWKSCDKSEIIFGENEACLLWTDRGTLLMNRVVFSHVKK